MNEPGIVEFAAHCLCTKGYIALGAAIAFQMPEPPAHLLTAALAHAPEPTNAVETWCIRNEVARESLKLLLGHDDARVAASAASGIWYHYKSGQEHIPSDLLPCWRSAVVRCPVDAISMDGMFDQDPELACDWLASRLSEQPGELWQDRHSVGLALRVLRTGHRSRLIELLPERQAFDRWAASLVGDDVEAYRHLLSIRRLARRHLEPLAGEPRGPWIDKAIAALDAGCTAESIADAMFDSSLWFCGPESEMWQRWIEGCEPLLRHADIRLRKVAELSVAVAQQRLTRAQQRERTDAIYGRCRA